MKPVSYLFVLLVFFVSCNRTQSLKVSPEAGVAVNDGDAKMLFTSRQAPPIERKLIKTGSLDFETKNIKETKAGIDQIVKELSAYSSNEETQTLDDRIRFSQTIRVPAGAFDNLIQKIEGLATKVELKSVNVQDVTEEFVDVEARFRTKKDVEARYREILKQAKTVQEILSVETELGNVRTEIEASEGRLKYLNSQVSMSTLTLSYYERIGTDFGFGTKLIYALKDGWGLLLSFIVGLIHLWPFILLGSFAVWFFRRQRKTK